MTTHSQAGPAAGHSIRRGAMPFGVGLVSWRLAVVAAMAGGAAALLPDGTKADDGWPRLFRDDFSSSAQGWTYTDAKAWSLVEAEGGQALALVAASQYKPRHRSPFNIALRQEPVVGDFELTARLKTTTRSYGHRDLCLFFGYQDPEHFYYVHLGEKADDHANQIFIVNDAPRTKISLTSTPGTKWDDAWHTVRVRRQVSEGAITVFFDDLEHPVMTASDATFTWGQVGLGSFDDTGLFDEVELKGQLVERPVAK